MHVYIQGRSVARVVYIYYHLLVSVTLLKVGWQGRCSSCKVYTHLLSQMAFTHGGFFFYKVYLNTLDV